MTDSDMTPEFSVEVKLDSISDEPKEYHLKADNDQKSALARRFGLLSIDSFETDLVLSWLKPGQILAVKGRILAGVTQACVVTLEPVTATLDEEVEIIFARNSTDLGDLLDPNEVEALEDEILDIGEVAAEELSLALDPYPRHPDVDPSALELGPGAELVTEEEASEAQKRENPFGILAELKGKS